MLISVFSWPRMVVNGIDPWISNGCLCHWFLDFEWFFMSLIPRTRMVVTVTDSWIPNGCKCHWFLNLEWFLLLLNPGSWMVPSVIDSWISNGSYCHWFLGLEWILLSISSWFLTIVNVINSMISNGCLFHWSQIVDIVIDSRISNTHVFVNDWFLYLERLLMIDSCTLIFLDVEYLVMALIPGSQMVVIDIDSWISNGCYCHWFQDLKWLLLSDSCISNSC